MEKKIKYQSEEINGKWYVCGDDLKLNVPNKEYGDILSNVLMNIEIPNPNFNPGRKRVKI